MEVILAVIIPFIGTTLGAAGVFFLKGEIGEKLQKILQRITLIVNKRQRLLL